MKINAMAAMKTKEQLRSWSYDSANLGLFDCLMKVKSCGICHSDIHMIDNDWGFSRYPLVPGHEIVGEIVQVGSEVKHLKVGDRVGVGWQSGACLQCEDCLKGNDNMCSASTGVISHGYGGFADHAVLDSRYCFVIPKGIETDVAGPLMCGGVTVYGALRSAGMSSGQEIGVIGIGGLGHMAVQFAAKLGNRVTVFTTSKDKAEFAAKMGASEAIVTPSGTAPKAPARPLNIIISTVTVEMDHNPYVDLLATDGTLTFVGAPSMAMPLNIQLGKLLFKRRRIMGSIIGSRAMIVDMLSVADRFGVKPIIEKFPLSECNKAMDKVRQNKIRYRAVLTA